MAVCSASLIAEIAYHNLALNLFAESALHIFRYLNLLVQNLVIALDIDLGIFSGLYNETYMFFL